METLSKANILEIIEEYIKDSLIDNAILIDGEWGCGKTYFYKKDIKPIIKKVAKKPIYVSLYGATSAKEVEEKVYFQMIESIFPEGKTLKIVKKGGKFVIETIKVVEEMVESIINVSLPNISKESVANFMGMIEDYTKYVLIFDDLERCNMPPNIILGCINQFVEHRKCKCIIITNQKEMSKTSIYHNFENKLLVTLNKINMENKITDEKDLDINKLSMSSLLKNTEEIFNDNNEYNQIKEKLIGQIIYYKPDYNEIIDYILKKYSITDDTRIIVDRNKRRLINQLNYEKHNNIRTLKIIIYQFNKILKVINNPEIIKNSDYDFIIDNILIKISEAFIEDKIGKNYKKYTQYDKYFKKEEVENFEFINKLVKQGYIDEELLDKELKLYIKYIKSKNNNPDDSMNKLSYIYIMEDDEVIKLLDKLLQKLKDDGYNISLYPKILCTLVKVKTLGFSAEFLEKSIKYMKKNILNNQYEQSDIVEFGVLFEDEIQRKEYDIAIKEIREFLKQNDAILEIRNFVKQEDNWAINLSNYSKNNEVKFHMAKKYLDLLDIDELVKVLENSKPKEIFDFRIMMNSIYSYSNLEEFFKDDIDSIKELNSKLKLINMSKFDKIKQWNLKELIKVLDSMLSKFN